MGELWQRLRQRKLVQWAAAYVAGAFAFVQVLDVVAQRFGWPDRVEKTLILALALGFLVTLVLAWYHGERGAQQVGGTELLIIALLLGVGGGALWVYGRRPAGAPAAAVATGPAPAASNAAPSRVLQTRSPDSAQRNPGNSVPDAAAPAANSPDTAVAAAGSGLRAAQAVTEKSVAVLPFANESDDKNQRYFSDGLSDDLITALSQFDGLKVISRNSAFQFRDSRDSSATIGRVLGVAHLLEGSVQRAGDEVRITATLVNAASGTVLWSARYDKPYKDLFALQDAITQAVADALKAKLLTVPGTVLQSDRPPSGSLAAYNALLQGRFYGSKSTLADQRKSIDFYRQAIALDPHYAAAYAQLGFALYFFGPRRDDAEQKRTLAGARIASATALSLAPNLGVAHLVHGFLLRQADGDAIGALPEYRRGYELDPHSGVAMDSLGHELAALGQLQAAIALYRKAIIADPLRVVTYYNLSIALASLGELDQAEQVARKGLELRPDDYSLQYAMLVVEVLQGRTAAVLQWADQQADSQRKLWFQAAAFSIAGDQVKADAALRSYLARYARGHPYETAQLYALRRQADPMFAWLDRDAARRAPRAVTFMLSDPWFLRYRDDPRFVAFCKKVGLPTTTDAKALKL